MNLNDRLISRQISQVVNFKTDKSGCSVADCLKLMSEVPGSTCEDSLFMLRKGLFLKPVNRELFVALDSPQFCLAWLKHERCFT